MTPENFPLTDLQKAELERRKLSYRANPDSCSLWKDVQRRIIDPHG
ncbi:MAG: addiction module protein [Cyanobacteria bacterium]|nr:addiction module protein [Cyanobacteriota bacterium]